MNIAIILAGGVGKRMGANVPKQFIEVQGKPIIIHTLEKFENHPEIDAIQIVCVKDYITKMQELIERYSIHKGKWIVEGGATFNESVKNGVYSLSDYCSDDDIVLIHMSVAPFIEDDIITDSLEVCREKGNAISMNPCLLCMGEYTTAEYSSKSVLRETLVGLNTPQTFRYKYLHDIYHWAEDSKILDKAEPHLTSLAYAHGDKLYFSKGSQYNFKITTIEDLDLFKAYLIAKSFKEKL